MRLIIDVRVKDLQRAVDFYTNVLGLVCRIQEKDWAGIIIGNAEIHLYMDGGVTSGVEFYIDDIDVQVNDLKEKGAEFISGMKKPGAISVDKSMVTTFPWGKIAYFRDSEGNELALVQDN